MFRLTFIARVSSILFSVCFILLFYLFVQNIWDEFFNNISDSYFEFNDYSFSEHTYVSTNIRIIPMPRSISTENSILLLSNDFRIVSNQKLTKDFELAIIRYSKYISSLTGLTIKTDQNLSYPNNSLIIDYPTNVTKDKVYYPELHEDESYTLNITKSGIYLYSLSYSGIIRGLSTFVQLIERNETIEKFFVPFVNIIDRPRFPWRGLLLDVARHWMPISVIKRTLNAMELSKLNVLHLHLSDDHGFRVENIQHNLLHDRKEFFTQKDIKYIVEYARQRCIRIVPEFDIPAHTTSWFVGYPELASIQGSYKIETQWGVMKATIDPTKESTYKFLDILFQEMTELFPDPYFHIGGDEVEGSQWMESFLIQQFIYKHELKDNNGLHAYFNKRIQGMLKKYGKIMVGWEEILDENSTNLTLDKDVVVQSWKNRTSLFNAIDRGYRALLSYGYYLDYVSSSSLHYKVNPIHNDELWLFTETQLNHILGGEACMWSEYVSQDTVDSRIWPRILAIAERFWSSSSIDNENFLYERLFRMSHLLDKMQTGVIHLSSYKDQLQNLISKSNNNSHLLNSFIVLADVCEPLGRSKRYLTGRYSSKIPLTSFADALQPESELIWKLENLLIDSKIFHNIFHMWSTNHLRLQNLFNDIENKKYQELWIQDVQKLSENLAQVGRIGLRILDYGTKRILHPDKNHSMNRWSLSQWIKHHNQSLNYFENRIDEVRLAAVRPVRRLLNSILATF